MPFSTPTVLTVAGQSIVFPDLSASTDTVPYSSLPGGALIYQPADNPALRVWMKVALPGDVPGIVCLGNGFAEAVNPDGFNVVVYP